VKPNPGLQVSVIIPVYNAAAYVRQAVESALEQPQTAEVLLIEDGSPDESLGICRALAAEYPDRVRLLRHPDGANRGAGPSRNLGLREAQYEYIAFLDADDFFLPARFEVPEQIFQQQPDVDGVYEATGFSFASSAERQEWSAQTGQNPDTALTTVRQRVAPEALFDTLYNGEDGHFDTNSLVFKRALLARTGDFPPLRLHQDTVMWMKMAMVGRLVPGRLEQAVAMRRVHPENRARAPRPTWETQRNLALMWVATWLWSEDVPAAARHRSKLLVRVLKFWRKYYRTQGVWQPNLRTVLQALRYIGRKPIVVLRPYFWKLLAAQLLGR